MKKDDNIKPVVPEENKEPEKIDDGKQIPEENKEPDQTPQIPEESKDPDQASVSQLLPIDLVVVNCSKLNVREKPNKDSKVLHIVDAGTEFYTNAKPLNGWVRVYNDYLDIKGFVMEEYIEEN